MYIELLGSKRGRIIAIHQLHDNYVGFIDENWGCKAIEPFLDEHGRAIDIFIIKKAYNENMGVWWPLGGS